MTCKYYPNKHGLHYYRQSQGALKAWRIELLSEGGKTAPCFHAGGKRQIGALLVQPKWKPEGRLHWGQPLGSIIGPECQETRKFQSVSATD